MNQTSDFKERLFFPILLVASVSVFPTVLLYARNIGMIPFTYALPFLAAFFALGLLAYGVSRLILHCRSKAGLLAAALMAIFLNFGLLDRVIPALRFTRSAYVLCGLGCLAAAAGIWLILRRLKNEIASVLCMAFGLVFAGLVVINALTCGIQVLSQRKQVSFGPTPQADRILSAFQAVEPQDLPNIYLLVFDEYAGPWELESYYHFDNSDFYEYLQQHGFSVSENSTNYMVDTMYCMADLVNLQHLHPKGYQEQMLRNQIHTGVLYEGLKSLGYTLYSTDGDDMSRLKNPIPDLHGVGAPTAANGDTYIKVFLNNTAAFILYDNIERAVYQQRTSHPDAVNMIMNYYATADFSDSATFHLGYICSPHGAFFFDDEGNRIDTPDDPYGNFNWTDKNIYLGQLQYVNTLIERAVDNILSQDPDSIILLMSDHGARNHGQYGNSDVTDDLASNILMAVYFRGQNADWIQGLSGVNVLRTLCNKTFGTDFEMLDYWNP